MTQPESPNPAGQATGATPEHPVQRVQGRNLMGGTGEAQASASAGNPEEPKLVTGKVRVDWGGVERDVDISDLGARARSAEEALSRAEALAEAARQQIVRNEAIRGLADRFEKMTPQQRAIAQAVFQDPDSFQKRVQPPRDPAEDDPFLAPPPRQQPPIPDEIQQRIAQLEQSLGTVASFLTELGTERQARTIAQQVEAEMGSRPIFAQAPTPLVGMARNYVLTRLSADPKANISDLVTEAAKLAAEVHQGYAPPGLASRSGSPPGEPEKPRVTGQDL